MFGLRLGAKQVVHPGNRRATFLLVVFLGMLWAILINNLRVEWTLNPQYGYGWAVPFLCVFLLGRKLAAGGQPVAAGGQPVAAGWLLLGFLALAGLYAPTRLIQEANPEWRLVSWGLGIEVVGLTLLLVYLALGAAWLKRLAFPIAYFLVAVPWPTKLEGPLIQGLTRTDASAAVELLGWLGVPALPHGNVIEVATGSVGIDDACSGIRSFQATLMISLFLGEFYHLKWGRRLGLVLGGFIMSLGFNLARMSVLVWVAARWGTGAIARWHDPTGVTILLACFLALWILGMLLVPRHPAVPTPAATAGPGGFSPARERLVPVLTALLVWIAVVEISVETWYRGHEMRLPPTALWTVAWPTNNPTFTTAGLPDRTRQMLRFDEGVSAAWLTAGLDWQAVFLRWNPGRTALHLAQNHTPEICLTAIGNALTKVSERTWLTAGGVRLPFIIYAIKDTPRPIYVFYCLWDDRTSAQGRGTVHLSYGNRLAPVWAGLRNPGQRSLEIILTGNLNVPQAEAAVENQLGQIIRVGAVNGLAAD